ncbi:hypothetical protein WJX77_000100 [Trebouxia sp. C0004]
MSTEVFWVQQAISNIQASVKSCEELSPAPDTPKDNGDAAGVVRVIATGTSGLSKADNKSRGHSKLYWWDEVPAVLQFNPYIKSGYRAGLTPQECVGSLFHCHNETGNIWVHLALLLGCMSTVAVGMIAPWPLAGTALLSLLLPVMLCLAGSVIYHTLMANHWNYKTYISIDVCGVFALFLSGAHNFMWWGLYCYPRLRVMAVTAYFITAGACVLLGLTARSNAKRATPMLVLLLLRFVVVLARLILNSGSRWASMHFLWMEVLTCTGAVVNVMRIPEKWYHDKDPRIAGRFDYWLNSHQIMHILVAGAMIHYSLGAACDYLHFMKQTQCPAWELM